MKKDFRRQGYINTIHISGSLKRSNTAVALLTLELSWWRQWTHFSVEKGSFSLEKGPFSPRWVSLSGPPSAHLSQDRMAQRFGMGDTGYSLSFKYSTWMQSLDTRWLSGLTVNSAEFMKSPPPSLIVITSSHLLFPFFILISIKNYFIQWNFTKWGL